MAHGSWAELLISYEDTLSPLSVTDDEFQNHWNHWVYGMPEKKERKLAGELMVDAVVLCHHRPGQSFSLILHV